MNLSNTILTDLYEKMLLIRSFEETMRTIFRERSRQGIAVGALHSCEGQEAVPAGVCGCLRKDDYVFSTHRGHGHALAKGADLGKVVAELLGKSAGLCKGWGGSMHLFAPDIGLMGGNGIVGGGLPLVLGAGYSIKYRGTDQVAVCFFGEGASAQGSFHESLNMAAIQKYPIIYICENNLYAATTHVSKNCPIENIADRAQGYGIPGYVVYGNDVLAVYETTENAVRHARAGHGPVLIECKTYRFWPHCMVIPENRAQSEIEGWRNRDPIMRFENRLVNEFGVATSDLEHCRISVKQQIEEAVALAYAAKDADPADQPIELWS
jgi:acetoin:2,6-dichlorophenolindophenol oxidoreductase subunit alpha